MTTLQKILALTIILVGLGILIWLTILIRSPLSRHGQTEPNPPTPKPANQTSQNQPDNQDLSARIEQIVLTNLKTQSLDKALAKFKKLSEKEKTKFIEAFLAEAGIEVIEELLGKGKSPEVLRGLPTGHQRFITQLLAEISGLSPKKILYLENLTNIATMLGLQEPMLSQSVTISFTTKVNKDNTPQDNRLVFRPSEHIIYACFPTKDGLKGLRYISIKWIKLDSDKIIYQNYKLIDPDKLYNYVWVKSLSGWRIGKYVVRIFDLSNNCLAQGGYEVKY